jgi:diguanylate cyclase (GGDEF)-like protein
MPDPKTLTALYDSIRRIGLSDTLDDVLETVLEQARRLIGFDHAAIMLYDEINGSLSVQKVLGYGERAPEILGLKLERGQGLSGWAAEKRAPARSNDVSRDPRYVPGLEAARSNLAVPLLVTSQVAGVLNIESDRTDAFTEEHEELLTILGSQAALAISAALARRRLRRKFEQLNGLFRISQLASQANSLDATLEAILELTEELISEGHIALLLLDDKKRSLAVRASRGYEEAFTVNPIPLGEGVTGRCAESGNVLLVQDVFLNEDYIEGVRGARSELALPLKVEGRVIGVLNAESTRPHAYSGDHVRALSVIAQQAAVVIRAAQVNEEARRLAVTDSLTDLHNRRYFLNKLETHLKRAIRYGERLALMLVDCDRLKAVNDVRGHPMGDRALRAIADLLRRAVRETDEVARIGGDEFACLLLHAGREQASAVAERVRRYVQGLQLISDEGEPITLTVSVGIALVPDNGMEANALLKEVDRALYQAKEAGRDAVAFVMGSGDEGPSTADLRAEDWPFSNVGKPWKDTAG